MHQLSLPPAAATIYIIILVASSISLDALQSIPSHTFCHVIPDVIAIIVPDVIAIIVPTIHMTLIKSSLAC